MGTMTVRRCSEPEPHAPSECTDRRDTYGFVIRDREIGNYFEEDIGAGGSRWTPHVEDAARLPNRAVAELVASELPIPCDVLQCYS